MEKEEVTEIFDQQAASYDQKRSKMEPISRALHLLSGALLSELPSQANILCVGSGTGTEILYLAEKFPEWRFMAVEPSQAMLEVCKRRALEQGIFERCEFHCGYLETLGSGRLFDAATTFLVSQFILDRKARSRFFRRIAEHLQPRGLLLCADLAGAPDALESQGLMNAWFRLISDEALTQEGVDRMKDAYRKGVAILSPDETRKIIEAGGFESPMQFYQAGLIHAWVSSRSSLQSKDAF